MLEPIRVALVNHSARLGGAELALLHLVTRFDRAAVHPTVLLGEEGPLAERLRAASIDVAVLPLDPRLGAQRKDSLTAAGLADPVLLSLFTRAVARTCRALRGLEARIVHTNSLKAHLLGGVAGRLVGAGVLWHVRDHIDTPYLPPAAVRAVRLAARLVPHRVVAVSESAARTVGRSDVSVLYQGVPLPELNGDRAATGRLRVGLVGRIAPWKGQHVFLAAAARLARAFPEAEFVLAGAPLFGEEAYERELRRQAECLLLAGRVRFLGFREDVWEVYRELDVAVHASTLPEPYGNVVLEAMASRTPVVAAGAGGVLELVEDGRTGVLVPPGDPVALAAALERLLRDPEERRRLGDAGRRHVEERFSLARDARFVERLYRELVA